MSTALHCNCCWNNNLIIATRWCVLFKQSAPPTRIYHCIYRLHPKVAKYSQGVQWLHPVSKLSELPLSFHIGIWQDFIQAKRRNIFGRQLPPPPPTVWRDVRLHTKSRNSPARANSSPTAHFGPSDNSSNRSLLPWTSELPKQGSADKVSLLC